MSANDRLDRLDLQGIWTEHRPGISAVIGQPAIGRETGIRCTAIIQEPGVTRLRWHRTQTRERA